MKTWMRRAVAVCALIAVASAADVAIAADQSEAKSDSVETTVNKAVEVDVLSNDKLGDKATVTAVGTALNGTAAITDDKMRIAYTPNENFVGTEVIRYTGTSADTATTVNETLTVNVRSVVDGITSEQLTDASIILFQALILALVLEVALQLIFTSRWFILYAEGRGLKVPVMFVLALLLINRSDIDIVQRLIAVFSDPDPASTWLSVLLSALIVGGGSSTIFQLFKALNLRAPASEEESAAFRRAEFARVTFHVHRESGTATGKALDVFVDGNLYGSIPADQNRFPTLRVSTLPVPTSAKRFTVAIRSDYTGNLQWTRELSVAALQSVDLHFDLTSPPPQPPEATHPL